MKTLLVSIISVLFPLLASAQQLITLDLKAEIDNGTYELEPGKELWTETYNPAINILTFNGGMFNFSHIPGQSGGEDVGGGMSYWDGFTLCASGDTTDYGMLGNSDGWVSEQWGCMAGGGLNESLNVEQGWPYLVAYWGFFYGGADIHTCRIDFDGQTHIAKGVYICNHPWPYYGNIHGDGFASAFTEEGSYFTITAHGLLNGEDTGSEVTLTLAENNGDGEQHGEDWPEGLVQESEWQWMDLEELGEIDGLYFTMASSDADPIYGPNTATYFCLDRLQIYEHINTEVPSRPSNLTTSDITEDSITLHWATSGDADSWLVYLNDSLVDETTDTLYCYTNLTAYSEYSLKVIAQNINGQSDPASVSAKTIDATAPTAPGDLAAQVIDPYTLVLTWTASTDNVAVSRYRIFLDGVQEARPKTNTYTLTGLDSETTYSIQVDAIDESGNVSEAAEISVRLADDPLAITDTNAPATASTAQIFTLDGQPVTDASRPGIYIINKRKIKIQK